MAGTKQFMKKIASSGGKATARLYGATHFKKLANKRWDKKNENKKEI